MQVGQYITFNMDTWDNEVHIVKEFKSKILDFCHDPLKNKESKCCVIINGEAYGIPFSEIKDVAPADGEQLKLI